MIINKTHLDFDSDAKTTELNQSLVTEKKPFLQKLNEENSVPNRLLPRKQSGIYMIRCIQNDWRYYGESSNVSGRLSSHRSLLNRNIHPNKALQLDWNCFSSENFEYIVLFMGDMWDKSFVRRGKEAELIILDRTICYNIFESYSRSGDQNPFWGRLHSPETKRKISEALKNRPNDRLGRKIFVQGVFYPSIAEASRKTGIARKTIRKKIDNLTDSNFLAWNNSGTVERPS
uniref:Putative GIY-YIG homing endonuclease n=1 Tax=Hazenia capsulata TaxID=2202518 RepID=A0A1W6EHL7_9CHLO|nr:putative GIY-YIG homing endonuclease [Hazenia capsulata]ARK14899.1 putative GIY-YIG homing endonuclease [Hazenia capsulata]